VPKVGSLDILCEIPTVLINLDLLAINNDRYNLNESYSKNFGKTLHI